MTKDQIIAMAREAGYDMEAGQRIGESSDIELFTRFASLVAAQAAAEEREKETIRLEARICEILAGIDDTETSVPEGWWETSTGANFGADRLAAVLSAIRERK